MRGHLVGVVLLAACREPVREVAPPSGGPATAAATGVPAAVAAVRARDAGALAALAAPDGEVVVEVRQRLSETDERSGGLVRGRAALLERLRAVLAKPVEVSGEQREVGDCLEVRPRSMEPGRVYLTRVCFAADERSARQLTYVGFAEAR